MANIAKKILLHICCGPCAAAPLKYLRKNYPEHEITGYFSNPNIHPYQEFAKRLATAKNFAQLSNLTMLTDENYGLEYFLNQIWENRENRCQVCYEMRLKNTAVTAKKEGFDAFTTTLLVSPYQKHALIKETAQKIAEAENIPFYYFDFRLLWQEGVKMSRDLNLYRQPYCGCIFSERERYEKKIKE
jgi:predicted adenine nucleotide alpha hydrolase (AANH) superfamily ATPase